MLNTNTFAVLDADSSLRTLFPDTITPLQAALAVVDLDRAEGRVTYDPTTIDVLQITPRHGRRQPFFVLRVDGRTNRPQTPARDPLTVEAARAAGQHFVVLQTPEGPIIALANPFGYASYCVTWTTGEYRPQQCGDAEGETRWEHAFNVMLFLCEHLRGHVVGFNERMGNSLERFHVVSHEPPHGFGPTRFNSRLPGAVGRSSISDRMRFQRVCGESLGRTVGQLRRSRPH